MSTRTVAAPSSYQRSGRQQEQTVNWGGGGSKERDQRGTGTKKDPGGGAVGLPLSAQKGYRLGSGSEQQQTAVLSTVARNIPNGNIESGEMERKRQSSGNNRRVGGVWVQEVNNGGGVHSRAGSNPAATNGRPLSNVVGSKDNRSGITAGSLKEGPKPTIKEYYAKRGADYNAMRRNNKVRLDEGASNSKYPQKVTIDYYEPPKGYEDDELPPRSQGKMSQSSEELPLSPAVLLASSSRRERKLSNEAPKLDPDEFIKKMQKDLKKKKETEDPSSVSSKEKFSSKTTGTATTAPNPSLPEVNGDFPDDSFNDSELILASQQVEEIESAVSSRGMSQEPSTNDLRKRDINGNCKSVPNNPFMTETMSKAPFTSTPVSNTQKKMIRDKSPTPKTKRVGLSRTRSRNNLIPATQNMSMFETSDADFDISPIKGATAKEHESGTPRKILKFDESESPIKPIARNTNEVSRLGDFNDDEDDEIFSQVMMPEEAMKPPPNNAELQRNCDRSTVGINNSSTSFAMESWDESFITNLDKLEALHVRSASTSGGDDSSNSFNTSSSKRITRNSTNNKTDKATTRSESSVNRETPKARRLGLARSNRSKK